MPVLSTDLTLIERAGVLHKGTAQQIADLAPQVPVLDVLNSSVSTSALSANQGRILKNLIDGLGDIQSVANIAARNALTGLDAGDIIHVLDDGDGKWARYQITAVTDGAWATSTSVKVGDQDWTGTGAVNLGYTAAPTQGTITNTNGTASVIPLATGVNAGLLAPAEKTKLGNIAVTQAVDLDALETASHAAATLAGAATTNPLTLAGQQIGFSIAQLAVAP